MVLVTYGVDVRLITVRRNKEDIPLAVLGAAAGLTSCSFLRAALRTENVGLTIDHKYNHKSHHEI